MSDEGEVHETALPLGPEDHRRVRLALRALAAILCLVGGVQSWSAIAQRDATPLMGGSVALVGAVMMVLTLRQVGREALERAIFMACAALLVMTMPATKAQYAGPVVICGPLVIVSLALPYLHGRRLVRLVAAAAAVNVINLCIAEYAPGPRPAAGFLPPSVLSVLYASLFTGLILFLLLQFSRRMRLLRRDEHESKLEVERLGALLQTVVRASPIAIAVGDGDGRIKLWNPAAADLFGVSEEKALGARAKDVVDVEHAGLALVETLRTGRSVPRTELQAGAKSGQRLTLEVAAAPLRRGDALTGFLVVATDISSRKKLEADLLQAQKLEGVGLLAGGIAHDFNNLLTIIIAEISMLQDGPLVAQDEEGLAAITEASRRAADLCRQLLSFSRRQLVQPKAHDLRTLLSEVLPMMQRMVGGAVRLHFARPERATIAKVDRSQFEQIVLNLVVNARDAMMSSGDVFFAIEASAGSVLLTVRDNGPGMEEAVRQRAFEPFFTTKENHGTGLGLATVAEIVRRAGGSVAVVSKVGEGTEFRVTLPSAAAEGSPSLHPAASPREQLRKLKVLVVDDDPLVQNVVQRILLGNACVVVTANDGQEALAQLEEHADIDVMVTDVIMPGLNGRVLAERAERVRPGLPVLFMSGYTTDAQLAASVESGAAHFLAKPFTKAAFEAALAQVSRRAS